MHKLNKLRLLAGIVIDPTLEKIQRIDEQRTVPMKRGDLRPKDTKNLGQRVRQLEIAVGFVKKAINALERAPAVDFSGDIPHYIGELEDLLSSDGGQSGLETLLKIYRKEHEKQSARKGLTEAEELDEQKKEKKSKEQKEAEERAAEEDRQKHSVKEDEDLEEMHGRTERMLKAMGEDPEKHKREEREKKEAKKQAKEAKKVEESEDMKLSEMCPGSENEEQSAEMKYRKWMRDCASRGHSPDKMEKSKKMKELGLKGLGEGSAYTGCENEEESKPYSKGKKKFPGEEKCEDNKPNKKMKDVKESNVDEGVDYYSDGSYPESHEADSEPRNAVGKEQYYPVGDKDESPQQTKDGMHEPYYSEQDQTKCDLENKIKVPSSILQSLQKEIDQANTEADKIDVRDKEGAVFHRDLAKAFGDLQTHIKKGTVYDMKQAQVYFQSLKSPMMYKVPADVVKFLAHGGQPRSLKAHYQEVKGFPKTGAQNKLR